MDTFLTISVSGKLPNSSFVRPYHLVVIEHKGHIVEVVAALLIITKPTLIRDVPHWVAKEAGPAGRSSRAGGARAAGPAGQSSRAAHLVAREAGPAGQKLQLTSFLGSNMFSTLITIPKNTFCLPSL